MGREWTRRSIEELIDEEVHRMIEDGEIEGGSEPVDYRNPYNFPFTIESQSRGDHTVQIQSIGIVTVSCFNPKDIISYGDTDFSYPLAPKASAFSGNYPETPPVMTDDNVKMAYALTSYHTLACSIRMSKVSGGFGSTYSNFIILQGDNTRDTLAYIDRDALLFPDSQQTARTNIARALMPTYTKDTATGIFGSTGIGAFKARTVIRVHGEDLFNASYIEVIDNPPPIYFMGLGKHTITHSSVMNGITFNMTDVLYIITAGFIAADSNEKQDIIDLFNNANHDDYLYCYRLNMTDDQIRKWVNPNNPESVNINHINL